MWDRSADEEAAYSMVSYAARKAGEPKAAPPKEAPKGPMCALCGHQDAIEKIRERHGENPPHLATTVAGGKDLSVSNLRQNRERETQR